MVGPGPMLQLFLNGGVFSLDFHVPFLVVSVILEKRIPVGAVERLSLSAERTFVF